MLAAYKGEKKMNYVLVFVYSAFTSLIVSFFVSMIIGNTVGIHYLNKHDKDWQNMLNRILDDLKKHTKENEHELKSRTQTG